MEEKPKKNKIILVGYRATGKTTVAQALADRWSFGWVDLDVWIEEYAGTSIAEIFAKRGEPFFRDLEAQVVAHALALPQPLVVATGGGAPMREESRKIMKENGVVVWLTASVETIVGRMRGDASSQSRRPALTGADSLADEVRELLERREPIYREIASLTVDTDGKTVDEIVCEIADSAPVLFM